MPSPAWEVRGHCFWCPGPCRRPRKRSGKGEGAGFPRPALLPDDASNSQGTCLDTGLLQWASSEARGCRDSAPPSRLVRTAHPAGSPELTCNTHRGLCDLSPRALNGMHPTWRNCRAQGESAPLVFPRPSRQLRNLQLSRPVEAEPCCCPPARLPVGLCAAQPPTDAERCRWPTHAGVPCPSLTAEPGPRVPAPCLD